MFNTVIRLGIILNVLLKKCGLVKFFGVPSNQTLKKPCSWWYCPKFDTRCWLHWWKCGGVCGGDCASTFDRQALPSIRNETGCF